MNPQAAVGGWLIFTDTANPSLLSLATRSYRPDG